MGPCTSIRQWSALLVLGAVGLLIAGCGGGQRAETASRSNESAALTAQTTDVLQRVPTPTAERVASHGRLVAVYCRAAGRTVNPSRDERAGRALAELKVWLGEPDAVPLVRPAITRLRQRYPTCSALRLLRP
jgi:hypothetical protein